MGFFVDRKENDGILVIRYRLAALYYWLMWPIIFLSMYIVIDGDSYVVIDGNSYLYTFFLLLILITLAAPFWGSRGEISKAMKEGRLKVSGSKYSFRNPLTYQISTIADPEEVNTKKNPTRWLFNHNTISIVAGVVGAVVAYGTLDRFDYEVFSTLPIRDSVALAWFFLLFAGSAKYLFSLKQKKAHILYRIFVSILCSLHAYVAWAYLLVARMYTFREAYEARMDSGLSAAGVTGIYVIVLLILFLSSVGILKLVFKMGGKITSRKTNNLTEGIDLSTDGKTVALEDSVDPDGIWCHMSLSLVDTYQKYIDELFEAIDIEAKGPGYEWTKEDGDIIINVTSRAHEKDGLSFLYIQTLIELYLDADRMVRQLHKNIWVRTVTGTDELPMWDKNFFPDPFPVMKNVRERFFEG